MNTYTKKETVAIIKRAAYMAAKATDDISRGSVYSFLIAIAAEVEKSDINEFTDEMLDYLTDVDPSCENLSKYKIWMGTYNPFATPDLPSEKLYI